MATILSDREIKLLIGTVIENGYEGCVKSNSYRLRLGSNGEFIHNEKKFVLGEGKKAIGIAPGHSAALTAFETLNFKREVVHRIFPNCDLHAMVFPTTDLSREGIIAPTTQVDAGYRGTLNWTINNTSSNERQFAYQEQLFRLLIFKLSNSEIPEELYDGNYQDQLGYVESHRQPPKVGIKKSEWEKSFSGENGLTMDDLKQIGYPHLGVFIDGIDKKINELKKILEDDVKEIKKEINSVIQKALIQKSSELQLRWMVSAAGVIATFIGLGIAVMSSPEACGVLKEYGIGIGLLIVFVGLITIFMTLKRN